VNSACSPFANVSRQKKTANLTRQVTVGAEAGEEELVVSQTLVEAEQANDKWMDMLDRDGDRWRNLAATLILLGSILGIISGALILQGNPSELLNTSLFAEQESVDISGTALEDVDGSGVEGVTVQLLEEGSRILLQEAVTDQFGHYTMDNVKQDVHLIVFSKTGYETVERTFLPDSVGLDPVTMKPGEGTRYENNEQRVDGWTLDNAVALSSAIGLITVIAALFGIQSAVEIRRGKHYRRSQYLAGLALFSRGLIIVGPALILFGMVINVFARDDFEDRRED